MGASAMKRIIALLPPAVGLLPLVIGLILWQLIQSGPSPLFPAPSRWWTAIVALALNGALVPELVATLWTYIVGLVIACVLGFALGILIGTVSLVRRWSGMLLEYLRALPPAVIIPIAVLMVGYSPSMKIAVIAITTIWPVLLNTIVGVAQIQSLTLDVARSLRMPWGVILVKVVVPATIPAFLLGVRIAVPLGIIITLVIEMFTGLPGVGRLMILAQRNFNSAEVFGLLFLVGLLGFALNLLFTVAEEMILSRWPPRITAWR
jgi:ABC-type nitrate/sulfonate/bicarbonate transport system permease component